MHDSDRWRRVCRYHGKIVIRDRNSYSAFGTHKRFGSLALIKRAIDSGLLDSGLHVRGIIRSQKALRAAIAKAEGV